MICVGEDEVCEHTLAAAQECGVPAACLGGAREGFLDFSRLMEEASDAARFDPHGPTRTTTSC